MCATYVIEKQPIFSKFYKYSGKILYLLRLCLLNGNYSELYIITANPNIHISQQTTDKKLHVRTYVYVTL